MKTSTQCALFYGLGTQVWMYAQLDFSEPILTFFLLGAVYWIYPNCGENAVDLEKKDIVAVPLPWWEGLGEGEQGTQISEIPRTFTESLASCSPPPNLPHQGGGTPMLMTLGLGEGGQRHIILSGIFFGIAVTVKIASLILLPLFLLYTLYATYTKALSRLKNMVLFVIPVLVFGTGTVSVYNFIRFGSLFETGYDNEFNFWYKHVLQQFWNNLLSLEGSIFFYSPVIILVLFGAVTFYKKFKTFALFIFGIILTFFLFYPFTTNELYYGPRYLTPTLPFFLLIAGVTLAKIRKPSQASLTLKLRKWGITVLLILGVFQQLLGVVVNYHTYYWRIQYTMPVVDETIHSSPSGKILLATPKLPLILGHLWLVKRAVLDLFQSGGIPLTGVKLLSNSTQHNAWIPYYGLDLWWCNPSIIHMTGWVFSGMIVVVLLGMMGLALWRLTRI